MFFVVVTPTGIEPVRGRRLNRLTKGPFNYLLSVAYFTGGSQDVKEKYLEKI